jgi:hypothetical protein
MLDERRRLGQDVRDEMWDGVLHMVPPPGGAHQDYGRLGVSLMIVAHPHDRRVELLRALGGQLVPVQPGASGELTSEVLGIVLRTVDGKLEISWSEGSATV